MHRTSNQLIILIFKPRELFYRYEGFTKMRLIRNNVNLHFQCTRLTMTSLNEYFFVHVTFCLRPSKALLIKLFFACDNAINILMFMQISEGISCKWNSANCHSESISQTSGCQRFSISKTPQNMHWNLSSRRPMNLHYLSCAQKTIHLFSPRFFPRTIKM